MSTTTAVAAAGPGLSSPSVSRILWHRLRRDRAAVFGLTVIGLMVLIALFAPVLTALEGQDPNTHHPELLDPETTAPLGSFGGASGSHWLGVEPSTGRDLLARLAYGARISLGVALGATTMQMVVGVTIGMLSGLGNRWVDAALGRLTDLALAFPAVVFAIGLLAIVSASVPRPLTLAVVIALVGWGGTARLARGQTLSLRTRDYVAAARLAGGSPIRVARREILPGLIAPVLTYAALLVPSNMIAEAGLSFLGVGVRPPTPSWGQMLSGATIWVVPDPTYVALPGALLFATLLAFVMLADAVRKALDPKAEHGDAEPPIEPTIEVVEVVQ